MIELYAKGTTDFSRHGIALAASQAAVTWQDNGRYDMDLTMPYNAQINIDYGMIVRCPVPVQDVAQITLGQVSYWEIASGETDVPLYKSVPKTSTVKYEEWQYGKDYAIGNKVSYLDKNYQALTAITGILTTGSPNVLPMNWEEIPRQKTTGGGVLNTLDAGDRIVRTGDYNSRYMKAADTAGHEGFIEISKCVDLSETGTRTVDAQHIEKQSFTITEITKSSDGKTLKISGEHISYQLGRTMLGECNISRANPATALLFIRGAMKEDYPGEVETNLTDEDALITGDFSWKNAQSAILDPKSGFLQATGGKIIRNDYNVYIIAEEEATPRYRITYGTNMKAVKWDGNVGDLVTRVYPIAQNADGSTLLLPEEHIDTVRVVPYIRPEALNTGLKVGQEETQEDGTKVKLDQDTVYLRMREAAQNRFTIDECDKAVITLEVDWQHLPDTAEYAQYAALMDAGPGEWVEVKNAPLGISATIQMTGYTFDPIMMRYQKGTFGKKKVSSGVASYDIQSGAVTGRAIASGAVGSQNIMAGSITAREIEANSITSDRIASRSITTEILAANCITSDEINAGAITAAKIAAGQIQAVHIAAGAIEAEAIGAGVIQAGHIASNAITTDKIAAGAVEATKIAALAITTEKLAAGAVTADKIGAGSITAGKISTDDLTAIQATLQIASIASAQIASADINYAHVKDLSADEAIFSTTITEQGVADKLYINRLLITYGQMVEATIGDLVIGDSNGDYYHIDVEWDEDGVPQLVPTQVTTPSAAEIAAGHTSDGKTIIGDVGTFAELSSEDFYAINSIIDRITAKRIDVDELWARQAFIDNLMVQDISSNTYIQSTIGNWASQSTITQTIAGINSRISQLGYGTIFYSTTEPSPSGVVVGDIWIEPIDDNTWNEIGVHTWEELEGWTWDQVAGQYRMYVWTGEQWKLLYDNLIVSELMTEIQQTAYAVTLKADKTVVDTLSDDVTTFAATLEVQAEAITAAVSAVNTKTSGYVQLTDPSLDSGVTLSAGDTWTKAAGNGTWASLEDYTWDELADLTWDELAGATVYTWDGTDWIVTTDYGATVQNRTLIEQTDSQVRILAEETTIIGDQVERNTASITVVSDRITQEVERATNAENGKISKTTQYQTADEIVSEAVSQSASAASGLYLEKTTQYQTPQAIVTEAVSQAASAASGSYIAKTSTYQTADSIVSAAQTYVNGQLTNYSTTTQTSSLISAYVRDNAYQIQSGVAITASGVTVSGGKYVDIQSSGTFSVTAANFGIRSDSSETYAIWAGASDASTAPFRVKPDGTIYMTKLIAVGENGSETTVNLRTGGLWKLNYHTVKSYTNDSSGYCSSMTLSNGTTVNFKNAAGVWTSAANGSYITVHSSGSSDSYMTTSIPGSSQGNFIQQRYNITGLTYYERAGETAYRYEGGRLVSFTIPSDCRRGAARLTVAT